MVTVSAHAISRYRERVSPVDYDAALAALSTRAIEAAADFGAHIVRLAGGQRVVIEEQTVVTVLPAENYRKQIARNGLGRYGRSRRFMEDE